MTKDIEHKSLNFKSTIILLLCGFIVFSPISSKITMNILKLPLALPEILFLPFYFYLKKRIDLTINKKVFLIGLFIITFLLAISFLVDNYPPTSVLSTARGYFHMLLSFSIFRNKEIKNINYIMFLAFGSTIGWLFANLLFLNELINNLSFYKTLAVYGNMIMLSLAMSIPIIFKKSKYVFFALIGGLSLSFSAGTRRQIIIFVSSYMLSFFLAIKWSFKGISKTILVALIFLSFILTVYPIAEEFIYDISPGLHGRIFKKSEQFITGEENSSDVHRTGSLLNFLNNLDENLFTRGFVSKRTMQDKGTGLYMDSPYTELFYTFSFTGAIFILLLLIKRLFFHFKNYLFKGVTESGVCVVSITTIFILIMVEGSFLNWSYITPCTGYMLARIFSSKNLIKN